MTSRGRNGVKKGVKKGSKWGRFPDVGSKMGSKRGQKRGENRVQNRVQKGGKIGGTNSDIYCYSPYSWYDRGEIPVVKGVQNGVKMGSFWGYPCSPK